MSEEVVIQKKDISKILSTFISKIIESNINMDNLALIGIRTRGAVIAERLVKKLKKTTGKNISLGILDITLYRDDIGSFANPVVEKTEINFDVAGKNIILVDDVLFTGRTIRAALDAIIDFGRPKKIELAVLIDRNHRELPIRADYVGLHLETKLNNDVKVKLKEIDGVEDIVVISAA